MPTVTELIDDLLWRGLIQDSTDLDELRKQLDCGPVTFYVGFDPTARQPARRHLMQVVTARRLQLAGLRPLLLVGGATGQIGDPKESSERTLNAPEVVAAWVENIRDQVAPFVTYTGDNAATLVNNLDWTAPMSAIDFLRDVGKHFPVNRMLAREVVRAAAGDRHQLHRVQLPAAAVATTTSSCTSGTAACSSSAAPTSGATSPRASTTSAGGAAGPVHAFVTPLVTKADGTKFGKTEGGAVWLDQR